MLLPGGQGVALLGRQVIIHARNHAATRLLLLRVLRLLGIALLLLLLRVLRLLRIALLLLLRVLRLLRIALLLLLWVLRLLGIALLLLLRVLLLLGLLVAVPTFLAHAHLALQVLDADVARRLAALLRVTLLLGILLLLLLLLLVGVQLIAHASLALGHAFDNFF